MSIRKTALDNFLFFQQIEDEISLKKAIDNNKLSKFKWELEPKKPISQDLNVSSMFKHGDVVWKVHKNLKLPLGIFLYL